MHAVWIWIYKILQVHNYINISTCIGCNISQIAIEHVEMNCFQSLNSGKQLYILIVITQMTNHVPRKWHNYNLHSDDFYDTLTM